MDAKTALVGSWVKLSTQPCSARYPSQLVLEATGSYVGTASGPGRYTHWDVGKYRLAGADRVELSTANDAIVSYALSLAQDEICFVDPQGCEVRYRRSP